MISLESPVPKLGVDGITVRQRNLDTFRQEEVYLFNISVHGGRVSFQIKWEHLGLSPQTIKALKENNAQPTRINFFNTLQRKLNKLTYLKKKIQSKLMVFSEPYWFVPKSKFEELADVVTTLRETALLYRNEILSEYDSEKEKYLTIVEQILQTTTLEKEIQASVKEIYLRIFPTQQAIASSFYIELFGPVRVPSIKEQSQKDAELAEFEARNYQAKALKELEIQFQRSLQTKLAQAVQSASDEFCAILAENLTRLQQLGSEDLSARRQIKLLEAVERCRNLVCFEKSLEDVAQQFTEITTCARNQNYSQMAEAIAQLKADLNRECHLISASGKGHRALAEWLSV